MTETEDLFLGVGDVVEAGQLLGEMTKEEVILQVVSSTSGTTEFEATFFGVKLGTFHVVADDNGIPISGGLL